MRPPRNVAEAPDSYNPLFIYGHTGLGKTHLLHAVANCHRPRRWAHLPLRHVGDVHERLHDSSADKRIEGFKQRYGTYDVLLMDSCAVLRAQGADRGGVLYVQIAARRRLQIVMSLDARRARSRRSNSGCGRYFEWGLITDIQPPDLENANRVPPQEGEERPDRDPSDPELLTFIASRVSTNIRELEGALTRRRGVASLTGRPLTVDLAQDVLKDASLKEKADLD